MASKFRVVQLGAGGAKYPKTSTIGTLVSARKEKRALRVSNPKATHSVEIFLDGAWEAYE